MRFCGVNYSKQRFKSDCFLVAFVNACKWAGEKVSYLKEFDNLVNVFQHKEQGTNILYLKRLFKKKQTKLPFNVTTIDKPKIQQINDHLDNDGTILFTYINNNKSAPYHSVLIVKRFGNQGYYFINESRKSTISIVENHTLKKYLKKHSFGFFLSKKIDVK